MPTSQKAKNPNGPVPKQPNTKCQQNKLKNHLNLNSGLWTKDKKNAR